MTSLVLNYLTLCEMHEISGLYPSLALVLNNSYPIYLYFAYVCVEFLNKMNE